MNDVIVIMIIYRILLRDINPKFHKSSLKHLQKLILIKALITKLRILNQSRRKSQDITRLLVKILCTVYIAFQNFTDGRTSPINHTVETEKVQQSHTGEKDSSNLTVHTKGSSNRTVKREYSSNCTRVRFLAFWKSKGRF